MTENNLLDGKKLAFSKKINDKYVKIGGVELNKFGSLSCWIETSKLKMLLNENNKYIYLNVFINDDNDLSKPVKTEQPKTELTADDDIPF